MLIEYPSSIPSKTEQGHPRRNHILGPLSQCCVFMDMLSSFLFIFLLLLIPCYKELSHMEFYSQVYILEILESLTSVMWNPILNP